MAEPTDKEELITRDWLAIERTRLANERTFLAYFRTGVAMMAGGVSILQIPLLADIRTMGIILTVLAPIILAIGVIRLFYVKRQIRKYYNK